MVIRKMLNNKWMFICLLIGSILTVAMVSSIPMYTNGVLQRTLIRDLEQSQVESGEYSGRYYVRSRLYSSTYNQEDRIKLYNLLNKRIKETKVDDMGIPILTQTENVSIDYMTAIPEESSSGNYEEHSVSIETLYDIQNHIEILYGRTFSTESDEDVYEVIINEATMKSMDIQLDQIYVVSDSENRINDVYKFKVVGVFKIKDTTDPFWFQDIKKYNNSFIMDHGLFNETFVEPSLPVISRAQWFYALDYHQIALEDLTSIIDTYDEQVRYYGKFNAVDFEMPAVETLKAYQNEEKDLKKTLWVFQVPILVLLAFYMWMVSQLIIDNDKNEIALLKSRGSSSMQIFNIYLFESFLLAAVSLLIGPPIGYYICKVLGASNGFLEFVGRTALTIELDARVYFYAILTAFISMITMLIPAFISSRTTIVQHKQKVGRNKKPLWQALYLDIILFGGALSGLYLYQNGEVGQSSLSIDPQLFLLATLFILGIGLVFLRVYPFIISCVYKVGKRWWTPVSYVSFIQVARSGGKDKFLMLFLIFTLSIGIFNANVARTLNENIVDNIMYQNGGDVVLTPYWPKHAIDIDDSDTQGTQTGLGSSGGQYIYDEPPFTPYEQLSGIESATKVFRKENVSLSSVDKQVASNVYLMGIIPDEFGKVAWFRNGLLPYHWYGYLNLLAHDQNAALLSSSLEDDVKLGDRVWIKWDDNDFVEVVVYGFIDYWPTFNPIPLNGSTKKPNLVVTNLSYIQNQLRVEPYEIWLKKEDGALSKQVYDDIVNKEIKLKETKDSSQDLIKEKNDPMLQSTNGSLTLGFIITMTISIIGFMIYWLLSIKKRVLQFGILRAMGLSVKKVISILICEQVLISGIAILMGVVIGGLTSNQFVHLLKSVNNNIEQVTPFRVVSFSSDYIKIYIVVTLMMLVGMSFLGWFVSKINISQAIKLGED